MAELSSVVQVIAFHKRGIDVAGDLIACARIISNCTYPPWQRDKALEIVRRWSLFAGGSAWLGGDSA